MIPPTTLDFSCNNGMSAVGGIMEGSGKILRGKCGPLPPIPKPRSCAAVLFSTWCYFYRRISIFPPTTNSGFYFKCPAGEGLVVATICPLSRPYIAGGPAMAVRRNIDSMLQHVELNETFDSFLTKLDGSIGIPNSVTQNFKDGWTPLLNMGLVI